ncbi:hypothetical protein [Modestobacter sp. NPDC049651]|uniref:hypothetical protein n=1 Tax=unclassified Modestobacter TaxID=2643866 RepID=UPI0033D6E047
MTTGGTRRGLHLARRADADRHALLLLVGLAGSIAVTRAYLSLTGYPTVGGDTLHIAHALWGGLLLLVGAVLALTLVNRAVLPWAALVTGVGAGLFVDEVGKFITVDNDYFFAAAAPIAYLVLVAALALFLRLRRRRDPAPASQLLAALELLGGAVDRDLSPHDRRRLEHRLERAAGSDQDDLARLAHELLDLTRAGVLDAAVEQPGPVRRRLRRAGDAVRRATTEPRLRRVLVVVLGLLALATLADLALAGLIAVDRADGATDLADAVDDYVRVDVQDGLGTTLTFLRIGLDAVVGVLLAVAAVQLGRGRLERGDALARTALLIALVLVDALFFYTEQFAAGGIALVHLLVLFAVRHHERLVTDA